MIYADSDNDILNIWLVYSARERLRVMSVLQIAYCSITVFLVDLRW